MRKFLKKIAAVMLAGVTALGMGTISQVNAAEEVPEINLDGEYNAYFGCQTPNWTYRAEWNSKDTGMGTDYWGDFIYGNETKEKYGKVTDTQIKGNGTYTVSIKDFGTIFADDFNTANQDHFNLIYISTDIPQNDTVKITNVVLKIDGKEIVKYDEAVLDPDEEDYMKVLIQNKWNDEVAEIPFYNAPTETMEMSFTVTGFNYDNEEQKVEETTAEETTKAPEQETQAKAENKTSGFNPLVVIIPVAAVVVVVIVIMTVNSKKKNK